MFRISLVLLAFCLAQSMLSAQEKVSIEGFVRNASGDGLNGVTVTVEDKNGPIKIEDKNGAIVDSVVTQNGPDEKNEIRTGKYSFKVAQNAGPINIIFKGNDLNERKLTGISLQQRQVRLDADQAQKVNVALESKTSTQSGTVSSNRTLPEVTMTFRSESRSILPRFLGGGRTSTVSWCGPVVMSCCDSNATSCCSSTTACVPSCCPRRSCVKRCR